MLREDISEFILSEIQNKINDYDNLILSLNYDDKFYNKNDRFVEISDFNKREIFTLLYEIRNLKDYYNTSVDLRTIPS